MKMRVLPFNGMSHLLSILVLVLFYVIISGLAVPFCLLPSLVLMAESVQHLMKVLNIIPALIKFRMMANLPVVFLRMQLYNWDLPR